MLVDLIHFMVLLFYYVCISKYWYCYLWVFEWIVNCIFHLILFCTIIKNLTRHDTHKANIILTLPENVLRLNIYGTKFQIMHQHHHDNMCGIATKFDMKWYHTKQFLYYSNPIMYHDSTQLVLIFIPHTKNIIVNICGIGTKFDMTWYQNKSVLYYFRQIVC